MKITKGPNWDKIREVEKCVACSGSGWYDSTDRRGRPIPCASCNGTGRDAS